MCACRNSPLVCRFPQICHWTFADVCLQKFPPSLQISSNLPLDICWCVLAEIPPQFADFLKSATGHLLMCACRNPPSLQILSNLPLDICWCVLAEIPPSLQIFSNLPLDICLCVLAEIPSSLQILSNLPLHICWCVFAEIPPKLADFVKSATGHLLMCACRNFPQACRFCPICYWTFADVCLQKFPQFADFLNSDTGHLLMCACRNFSNLPLDICWGVLAEIPLFPFADIFKICHWTFAELCYTQLWL